MSTSEPRKRETPASTATAVVFSGCLVAVVAFALVAIVGSGWQLSIYWRLATEGFTSELIREALLCHGIAAAVWIVLYSPILALMLWIKPWRRDGNREEVAERANACPPAPEDDP